MLNEFSKHLNQNLSFLKDAKVLLAISGGVDSVVLAHLASKSNLNFTLAHCNFKLRNEASDLDEDFVKQIAKKLHIDCHTITFETESYAKENNQSTQMAARDLRYNWFQELCEEHQFDYIFTAHHADDNIETFLINLARGTGLNGLTGIPEINGNIVRPLLPFSRKQIIEYAKTNDISWREDESNQSTKYLRNKIRHEIVPVLKSLNDNFDNNFKETLSHLKTSQQLTEFSIEIIKRDITTQEGKTLKINIDKLNQYDFVDGILFELLKEYKFTEWNDVKNLIQAQSGKKVLSPTHTLLKDRHFLILYRSHIEASETFMIDESDSNIKIENLTLSLEYEQPGELKADNPSEIVVNKSSLKYPLIVRKWKNGDYFYPAGMGGKKKLSKFFKDEKFSLLEKQTTWLLCDHDDKIIWVIGHRLDNRFKAKPDDKNALKITIKNV